MNSRSQIPPQDPNADLSSQRSMIQLLPDRHDDLSLSSRAADRFDTSPFKTERKKSIDYRNSMNTVRPGARQISKISLSDQNDEDDDDNEGSDLFFTFEDKKMTKTTTTGVTTKLDLRSTNFLRPSPLKVVDPTMTPRSTPGSTPNRERTKSDVSMIKATHHNSMVFLINRKRLGSTNLDHIDSMDAGSMSGATPKAVNVPGGRMTFVGLIAMARKMGLIRRNFAYEDYMSKDQFNMIRDACTGRFDEKEEKRTVQMVRLKTKLMLNPDELKRYRRKRTHLVDWKENMIPILKRMYGNLKREAARVRAPNEVTRVVWDMYIMILIFYDLVMIPLTLSFDVNLPHFLKYWDVGRIASFFLDILINFNTGFYDKGLLVMERKKIFGHYITGWFWIDLVASIPFDFINDDDGDLEDGYNNSYDLLKMVKVLRFIRILRFLRIFKLKNIFVKLESYIDMSKGVTSIIGFVKLSLIILFIAHWFACLWHYVAIVQSASQPITWLTHNGIYDSPWYARYVASIYWATTTMITVGYGDIIPITIAEQLVAVMAMLVASAVFAYTMNRINLIMTGLETTSEQYQKALATITDYMRKKHVKKELQIKIKKYLEYALEVETSFDSNEEYLNAYLNQSLKNELITEIHGKSLLENPIFRRFDNRLIMKTSLMMKEKIFSPEDPVFLESDLDDLSIYLVHSGKIEIFNFKSNAYLKVLTKGNYFGELSFFTAQARSASARSVDFSALYLIKRNDFIALLDEFPDEREKFYEIKDKLSIYQNTKIMEVRCYSCGGDDHMVKDCPKVHLVINKEQYINRYIQKRTKFMTDYIRTRGRENRDVDRYSIIASAAHKMKVKIWEGEVLMDKVSQYLASSNLESPGLKEHHSPLANRNNKHKRKMPITTPGKQLEKLRSISMESSRRRRNSRGSIILSVDLGLSDGEVAEEKKVWISKKRSSIFNHLAQKRRSGTVIEQEENLLSKGGEDTALFDDIDRIQSYTNYFPHNNFEAICPSLRVRKEEAMFDYFSQSDTAKATMKKFISILKEKVRIRREMSISISKSPKVVKDENKKSESFKDKAAYLLSVLSPGRKKKTKEFQFQSKAPSLFALDGGSNAGSPSSDTSSPFRSRKEGV